MANDIFNSIKFLGETKRIKEIMESIKNDKEGLGSVDFNKIIAMPSSSDATADYEWCLSNWGTNCNAYEFMETEEAEEINFCTAWAAPHAVIAALAKMYPDVEIEHEWEEEWEYEVEDEEEEGFGYKLFGRRYKGEVVSEVYCPEIEEN